MRHFSCDLCGKTLDPAGEPRYLVRLEGSAVAEELPAVPESEADSVDAMDEFLTEQVAFEALEDKERDTVELPPVCAKREYDLCRGCYSRLLNDPLGLTARHAPGFSRN